MYRFTTYETNGCIALAKIVVLGRKYMLRMKNGVAGWTRLEPV
jgi:hypothetical protein